MRKKLKTKLFVVLAAMLLLSLVAILPKFITAESTTYVSAINGNKYFRPPPSNDPDTGYGTQWFNYTKFQPPPNATNYPRGYLVVNLTVTDVSVLKSWQVKLTWDPTFLEIAITGATPYTGDLYAPSDHIFSYDPSPFWLTKSVDNAGGTLFWGGGVGSPEIPAFNGSGTLFQIRFRIIQVPSPTQICNLTIVASGAVRTKLITSGGALIPFTPQDGFYQYTILGGPSFHDVAVIDVRTSHNFVYTGENVTVYVDIWNIGGFSETFNVTTYADKNSTAIGDEITIGNQPLSLAGGGFTALTFTWNTTGVPSGNYTISAVASNVTQEADLSDNLYIDGETTVFFSVPCYDINITCPTALTVNPSIFSYDAIYHARLINIGNVSIESTGYQGFLRVVGSQNGTIRLCINQPNVDVYTFNLSLYGEKQIPIWLMFQPETHWGLYSGNFTLELTICGVHRRYLKIIGISIDVCQNGAYIVYNQTVTFTWNLTGGSWAYLEAETKLPPGWSYSADPPVGTLFETPHIVTVNITAPPDAEEGDMGCITLRAYKNETGVMFWQFIYFASTDNNPPIIEAMQPPILIFNGNLLFNATVKDKSGIASVQFYYSVNNGPWNNQTMQWDSGDTFNSTSYTLRIPHVPDNSTVRYYLVATDWFGNQTQSYTQTIIVKYDLAITEVQISKAVVVRGFVPQINVSLANQGTIPNTSVKVVIYANTMPIYTQTIPFLINGTATTLTFNWNTTNVPKGDYEVTVLAVPLLGETDVGDNTYVGNVVEVLWKGDVNKDDVVDGQDAVIIIDAIPSYPGHPKWNSYTDTNGDNVVDGQDAVICIDLIPKTYP